MFIIVCRFILDASLKWYPCTYPTNLNQVSFCISIVIHTCLQLRISVYLKLYPFISTGPGSGPAPGPGAAAAAADGSPCQGDWARPGTGPCAAAANGPRSPRNDDRPGAGAGPGQCLQCNGGAWINIMDVNGWTTWRWKDENGYIAWLLRDISPLIYINKMDSPKSKHG